MIETMKINGLIMKNYWIVSFTFNYLYYCIISIIFWVFGKYVFEIPVFTMTSPAVFALVINGWGLA